ncbi:MAG: ATP-binding protein [Leptolyngbya sp. SIO1E4]|nr:ATP-binding protein [Leptolyngbya sp. SIO1E4]
MKYLSTSQQRWTARGLSGLGLSLMLGGGVMAYQNPQFQQAEQLRAVHKYGSLQQAVMIPQDGMMGRGLGLGLFVAGLATSGLGLWLSDSEPRGVTPEAVVKTTLPNGQTLTLFPPEDEVLANVQQKILTLLSAYPWLKSCMQAYCVVIVGASGVGKSTIANAIAVMRLLLWSWPVAILDPHGNNNLAQGTWSTGRLYGSSQLSKVPVGEQIAIAWDKLKGGYAPYQENRRQRQTIIVDEFTGWSDPSEPDELKALTAPMTSHCIRQARKCGNGIILLLHGDRKGTAGGDMPTGVLESLMKTAAVLQVEGQADEFGELTWSGKGKFKPPGAEPTNKHFQRVSLPDSIRPGRLQKDISELLDYLGIGLDDDPLDEVIVKGQLAELRDALRRRFDSPEFIDALNQIYEGPTAPSSEADDNTYPDPKWDELRGREDCINLLAYLKRNHHREIDVNTLKQNWGRKNNLNSREDIRSILSELIALHIGEWTDVDTEQWRVIPNWEDFPEWMQ